LLHPPTTPVADWTSTAPFRNERILNRRRDAVAGSCLCRARLTAPEDVMLVLLIVLLVLWLILAIVGFAIKGLLWLAMIGIVLFVGTAAIGAVRRRALRRQR